MMPLPRVCSLEAPLLERARGGLPTEASSIHYILVSEGLSARVSARPCLAYVHFKEMPYEFGMRPASKPRRRGHFALGPGPGIGLRRRLGCGRRLVMGSCVIRETTQTGCPWSWPRVSLSFPRYFISPLCSALGKSRRLRARRAHGIRRCARCSSALRHACCALRYGRCPRVRPGRPGRAREA